MMKKLAFAFFIILLVIPGFIGADENGTTMESGVIISMTEPRVVPPGPDYALMSDVTEAGAQRTIKKDGIAAVGETLFLDFRIKNTTNETVRNLKAELSSNDPRIGKTIFLEKREVNIGDLGAES